MEAFSGIHLDLSKKAGKCAVSEAGIGWKTAEGSDMWTLEKSNIASAQWSRAARGFELKIIARDSTVVQLDGFDEDNLDSLSKVFQLWFGIKIEKNEHATRGWNWGKGVFDKSELTFKVHNKPAFEIPYSEISNTNLAGRNEVAVEFSLPGNGNETGTNGAMGGARGRGRKAGGGGDQLVEMRFYIPGTTKKNWDNDDEVRSEDGEEINAANQFYDTLMEKADIGDVAGDTFATFQDVLHLTPRGRFDIDLYETSFRLRGKTYDYKIQYESVKKFFLLPKPDDLHTLITIGLEPPLRQGQTRYPFVVMQFKRDEETIIDLNMTEEVLKDKYEGRLQEHYTGPTSQVIAQVFRGLAKKKVTTPSKQFSSYHNQSGVKCSIKANEGHVYCLDKALMFVPKPATYISFDNISDITMSRVGGAVSASRTFDISVALKGDAQPISLSNINREEQIPLQDFFKSKGLKTHNEMDDDGGAILAAAMEDAGMSSDDEVAPARADRGSADEDDESVDEDFHASSDSDVAEEYDSAHSSSGGSDASDAEMQDAEADDVDDDEEEVQEERPKKKAKTGK